MILTMRNLNLQMLKEVRMLMALIVTDVGTQHHHTTPLRHNLACQLQIKHKW